jgi:hypothetical protein
MGKSIRYWARKELANWNDQIQDETAKAHSRIDEVFQGEK